MEQEFSRRAVSILHELNLGEHTLFIMSDGGIDLLANDEQISYLADNGMSLNSDETYRLFISLQEQFMHRDRVDEKVKLAQLAANPERGEFL